MYLQEEHPQKWIDNMSRIRQRKLLSCGNLLDNLYRTLHSACQAAVHWA